MKCFRHLLPNNGFLKAEKGPDSKVIFRSLPLQAGMKNHNHQEFPTILMVPISLITNNGFPNQNK
jgi:hypothetical protein